MNAFPVPSGADTQILVGARSSRLGNWLIPAFRLHYRAGNRRYETTFDQGLTVHVVPRPIGVNSSASFSSFQTKAGNIGCSYARSSGFLRCAFLNGASASGYEMKTTGMPRPFRGSQGVRGSSTHVLKPRASWLYHGFRCYAGRASIRCRNQIFEGFFLSPRRTDGTA